MGISLGARLNLISIVREQAMALLIRTDTCISCGRKEIFMRSCPGTNYPYQCASCRDERVARHQSSFGKLHITQQKLPHRLAMHICEYVHQQVSHSHTRRRFLLTMTLRGKAEAHSNLQTLHGQLAAHRNVWHSNTQWYKLGIFGLRSDLFTRLVDLVIGPETMQVKHWCPWCHGSGCS